MSKQLNPRRRFASTPRVALALAILAATLLAPVTPANAGVKKGSEWYFRGSTFRDKAGKQRADPVNLLFLGGGRVTLGSVGTHLSDDWSQSHDL